MRKINLLFLALTAVAFVPSASASAEPVIQIRDVYPHPAEPGDTVKMDILVKNNALSSGEFIPLQVETVGEVSYRGTTSNFARNFTLCGGCQMVGTLYFKVGEDVESGSYPVDITVSDGRVGIVEKTTLRVDGTPNILVSTAGTPEILRGGRTEFSLEIKNTGTDLASQVVLDSVSKMFSVQPSTIEVGSISPGETVTKTLQLEADEELKDGISHLRFDVRYGDESRTLTDSSSLPVKVLGETELALSNLRVKNPIIGKSTEMVVDIENTGPGEAEKLVSKLSCEGASVDTARSFVGQLEDGESVPLVFQATPTRPQIRCEITTAYTDSDREDFTETFTFSASPQSPPWIPILASLLLVTGASVYYWRSKQDGAEGV